MALTGKQKKFCYEYLIDLNATQAAIRSGYSPKTAAAIGAENLIKPNIQKYIQDRQQAMANKLKITQEMVLEGYRRLAFYDARKFYDEKGNILHVPDLDEETAFALSSFEVSEERSEGETIGHTKKIKTSDRRAALDSICKVLGFNAAEKHEISADQKFMEFLRKSTNE